MLKKIEQKINYFTGELKSIWNNQMAVIDLKNTISTIKNSINGFNNRLNTPENRGSELKGQEKRFKPKHRLKKK